MTISDLEKLLESIISTDEISKINKSKLPILSSSEIELFANRVFTFFESNRYSVVGKIIHFPDILSTLIQTSYNAGHNQFKINTSKLSTELNFLCRELTGTPEKPLEVEIFGNCGNYLGAYTENIKLKLIGNAKNNFAEGGENSTYIVDGSIKDNALKSTYNTRLLVTGNVKSIYHDGKSDHEIDDSRVNKSLIYIDGCLEEESLGFSQNTTLIVRRIEAKKLFYQSKKCKVIVLDHINPELDFRWTDVNIFISKKDVAPELAVITKDIAEISLNKKYVCNDKEFGRDYTLYIDEREVLGQLAQNRAIFDSI